MSNAHALTIEPAAPPARDEKNLDLSHDHDGIDAKDLLARPTYDVDAFEIQRVVKEEHDYLEFRSLGWLGAGFVVTAESIALGVLSFPSIYLRLGMVGATIATVIVGVMTYFSGWIMVDFKLRHRGVMNYPEVGAVMFGKWGYRILGTLYVVKTIATAGSHVLVGITALSNISTHAICNVWWGVIVTVVSILASVLREWKKARLWSIISVTCIVIASFMTIIGVAVQNPLVLTKGKAPIVWYAHPKHPDFVDAIGALTNILFSFGNTAVFTFVAEMREPQDFKKSFVIAQAFPCVMYVLVGSLIYRYGGQYVVSPALTMTTKPVRITSYAIALVTIMISGVLVVNVGAKFLYMSSLRNSPLLTSKGLRAKGIWMLYVSLIWIAGFVVAELIPFFNQLISIISAVSNTWFAFGLAGIQWFYMNLPYFAAEGEVRRMDTKLKWFLGALSILYIAMSLLITPMGLYSAIEGIITGYRSGTFNHPFAC